MLQNQQNSEKFKTMIGGQALIEGIMMRGPKLDAIVVRDGDALHIEKMERKIRPKKSFLSLPLIRGVVNFFDAQVAGVKALMHSADFLPEEEQEEALQALEDAKVKNQEEVERIKQEHAEKAAKRKKKQEDAEIPEAETLDEVEDETLRQALAAAKEQAAREDEQA